MRPGGINRRRTERVALNGRTCLLCRREASGTPRHDHVRSGLDAYDYNRRLAGVTSGNDGALAQVGGGALVVPVLINNAITLDFVIDSGASDVSIPADVVLTLMRTGSIQPTDFLGQQVYTLADGSQVPSQTFRIRLLKVGDRQIQNVTGSIAPVRGSLLLGQSFLTRFKSWSVDNQRRVLLLE